eukprot:TRINITY_DN1255_c0_g1_i2.p1 TRINITY_DN1255_c0_g1~~TRINITY_DN1255_c0_g1_i2.p1  ORF type:complete len:284 (+),score=28.82 TRINITY_DN1255_c0_g1_i2:65-916(+)
MQGTSTSTLLPENLQGLLCTYKHMFAAISSTCCSSVFGYPLDNLKTRMQAYHFKSLKNCTKASLQKEGLLGLYKGVSIQLAAVSFVRTTNFTSYELAKNSLAIEDHFQKCFVGGMMSGSLLSLITCPLEIVKIQIQLQKIMLEREKVKIPSTNPLKCLLSVAKERGFFGLYRGYSWHYMRDCIGMAIYFSSYEEGKRKLGNMVGSESMDWKCYIRLVSGGCAGLLSAMIVYPIDSIKTKYQKEIRKQGLHGFYSGMQAVLLRSFPLHAITLFVYDSVMECLGD